MNRLRYLAIVAALFCAAQARAATQTVPLPADGSVPIVLAATNNLTTISAASVTLLAIDCYGIPSGAQMWVKTFNGSPTMGTTNATWEGPIPGGSTTSGSGLILPNGSWGGDKFPNGLYVAITGGIALNDNTSVSANSGVCNVHYRYGPGP